MTKDTTIKKTKVQGLQDVALPIIDRLAQTAAGLFFLATAYGYVSGWLKTHQSQHDLSVAGGIMVVSIALYLFVRKR